ncbi:MAG: PepSY-like domain-containing protein [Bacteroides sp.]|nr:PepSY-like domain-containing protein [Bacteroides sp.]
MNGYKKEVWFDVSTHWVMTVTQIDPTELPNAVVKAIAEGEFSSWHIGEVDLLEFSGRERVYVLRMRSGSTDLHLYYGPQGELFKITNDTTDDYWPGMTI